MGYKMPFNQYKACQKMSKNEFERCLLEYWNREGKAMTFEDIIIILLLAFIILISIPFVFILWMVQRSWRVLEKPPKNKEEWYMRAGRIDKL